MKPHLFGQSKRKVKAEDLDIQKINRDLSRKMAEQIEFAIRKWIDTDGTEKEKALLQTIEHKEKMIKELSSTANESLAALNDMITVASENERHLTEIQKMALANSKEFMASLSNEAS